MKADTKRIAKYKLLLSRIRNVAPMYIRNHFDFYIAGGAIRDALCGYDHKDIDVFCVRKGSCFSDRNMPSTDQFMQAWSDFEENLMAAGVLDRVHNCIHVNNQKVPDIIDSKIKNLEEIPPVKDFADEDWDLVFRRKPNQKIPPETHTTIKLFDGKRNHKPDVQFLCNPVTRSIEEVLACFDLNVCMVAYDGKDFYLGDGVSLSDIRAVLNGGLPMVLKNPWSSVARIKRFGERYSIEIDDVLKKHEAIRDPTSTTFIGIANDTY